MSNKAYSKVTQQLIDLLEAGVVPWQKPWNGVDHAPQNPYTPTVYSGINVWTLWGTMLKQGWRDPRFAGFKQIKNAGGAVKKGERGSVVVYYFTVFDYENTNDDGLPQVKYRVPKYSHVFNIAAQTEGIELEPLGGDLNEFEPIERAEQILNSYIRSSGAPHYDHTGGDSAFYRPATDSIHMPRRETFDTPEMYYKTAYHEAAHSTGHAKRLRRDAVVNVGKFGSERYGREELTAEMTAAMLSAEAGIETIIENSAAYIAGWLKNIKGDNKLVIDAARQAEQAAQFILNAHKQPAFA